MKKIQIVSPAKSIESEKIDIAKKRLEDESFEVEVGKHASGVFNYFSASDDERLSDFQNALNDEDTRVILCARGGYGSVRIIDRLNWSQFLRYPKVVCGYSDVTVFHNRMNRMGYSSIHCTAPLNFKENSAESFASLFTALNGGTNTYAMTKHEFNKTGKVVEKVVGGNLAIICSLIGTDDELDTDGRILFIEDVGEAIYSIDRMMWQLKKSGMLSKLDGLIVGGMTSMKDSEVPFGKSVEEVISESIAEYDYPLCFNFPAGHLDDNRAIILGQKATLEVTHEGSTFTQLSKGFN